MKVYLVYKIVPYEGEYVESVYSNLEAARDRASFIGNSRIEERVVEKTASFRKSSV